MPDVGVGTGESINHQRWTYKSSQRIRGVTTVEYIIATGEYEERERERYDNSCCIQKKRLQLGELQGK